MDTIGSIRQALKNENKAGINKRRLDGWLFCNFAHKDKLTDEILALNGDSVSSRRWFYLIPVIGDPVRIVHIIEESALDSLPGSKITYSGRDELQKILIQYNGSVFAMLADTELPVISTVDAGTLLWLNSVGITAVSAARLIQRCRGTLDNTGIAAHERAAAVLYRTVERTWNMISRHFTQGIPLYEKTVEEFITDSFKEAGLITDHPPIVAFGPNSGNPHYGITEGRGRQVREGDIIQLDIWAKESGGIYADISWAGIYAKTVPDNIQNTFSVLEESRNVVYTFLKERLSRQTAVTGFQLDEAVRSVIKAHNMHEAIRHRTGHSIDTECHGSGVNLDSVEFPDNRYILEGSCFSVEPGLYFENYGLRTEINIYISGSEPIISGKYGTPLFRGQTQLLTIQ